MFHVKHLLFLIPSSVSRSIVASGANEGMVGESIVELGQTTIHVGGQRQKGRFRHPGDHVNVDEPRCPRLVEDEVCTRSVAEPLGWVYDAGLVRHPCLELLIKPRGEDVL